ncbi:MAG: leucine-rich repeat domain-containing protein [Lachnospiraceae bacterium]|nr:leucine-rich repeat domain-containing protein [Lachnospiraceae bacterium]
MYGKKSLIVLAGILCLAFYIPNNPVYAQNCMSVYDLGDAAADTENGDAYVYDGLLYLIDPSDGSAALTGAESEKLTKLIIPDEIHFNDEKIPVTAVDNYAFEGSGIKTVKFGANITRIGEGAFAFCSNLKKAAFPLGCKEISDAAFFMCEKLADIDIGSATGIVYIGEGAFAGTAISRFMLPDTAETVGPAAFSGCTELKSFSIGKKCSWIGEGAFSDCISLSDINVSEKNKSFSVKDGCIYYEDSQLISAAAAKGDVIIQDGTERILPYAFEGNTAVTSVTVPESVKELDGFAFANCTGVKKIILPAGLKSIGDNVFSGCTKLTGITVPKSVETICGNPFKYCPSLKKIKVAKGNKNYKAVSGMLTSYDKKTLIAAPGKSGSIELYSKCKIIGDFAFCGNTGLTSLKTNDKLKKIGVSAFYDCENLEYIYFANRNVSLPESSFYEDLYSTDEEQYCPVFGNCKEGLEINIPFDTGSGAEGSLEYMIRLHTTGSVIITTR